MKKKVISTFTILAIICNIFCIMPIAEVCAKSYEKPNYSSAVSSYSELESRLKSLIAKYKDTYWTTTGQLTDSKGTDSKSYYGIQCNGFAKYIFNDLFCTGNIGSYDKNRYYFPNPSGAKLVDKAWNIGSSDTGTVKNILSRGDIGDFIQVRRRGKDYGHSMIIAGKYDNGITIFDCNSEGHCKVRCYNQSYAEFASKNVGMSLYRSTEYPQSVVPPSYAALTVNGTSFGINETINFTATSDTATEYYLHIDKDSVRLHEPLMPDGKYSISLSEPGHYTANVTARNSAGWVDSEWIGFDIIAAPSRASLHTENYIVNYNVNDTVNFLASSDTATKYFLSVDKDSKRLYTEEMPDGKYSAKFTETGYYTACVTARNNSGWADSEYIGIRILKPADVGDKRNVYIENKHNGLVFTRDGQNVVGAENEFSDKQLWQLNRQSDGSYRIKSCYDDQYLEVFEAGVTNGTNISVYKYTPEFMNQSFYIYNLFDAYYIKPVCSDLFADMSFEKPNNVAAYGYADDWEHQKFAFKDKSDYETTAPVTTITTTTTTTSLITAPSATSSAIMTDITVMPVTSATQTETTVPKPAKNNADINGDGKINTADIVEFQKIALKKYNDIACTVDLNDDGVMNVFDMIILKRAVLAKS